MIKHSDTSLYTSGKEAKRGKACSLWHSMLCAQLWLENMEGCQRFRCAVAAKVMSDEVDMRAKGASV